MQEIESLHALTKFPQLLETQKRQLEKLILNESTLRNQLKEARAIAEQDTGGLDRLKDLLLDCLLQSHVPGIGKNDHVEIKSTNFLPVVYGPEGLEATVNTFSQHE